MRRVMIVGAPGSGKSTLARELGARLGLPVVHLDQLYHLPDWQPPADSDFAARVDAAAAGERWIIEGNYARFSASRLARADTIICCHVSRAQSLWRVMRRAITGYGRQRPDAAPGCRERIDARFIAYVWRWRRDKQPEVRAMLSDFSGAVIELRHGADWRALTTRIARPGDW